MRPETQAIHCECCVKGCVIEVYGRFCYLPKGWRVMKEEGQLPLYLCGACVPKVLDFIRKGAQ